MLELSQKLLTKGAATPAELTVLLAYAAATSQGGQVPIEVQQALREVLLKLPHPAEAIAKLRDDFMVPSLNDQRATELKQAFTALTGQTTQLDALSVKKLLALAASQGRLTNDEVAGLEFIADQPQVSDAGQVSLRSTVLENLVAQLARVAADPTKATPLFKDIVTSASKDGRFFGAAEEAYFGSTFDGTAAPAFRQLASTAPDATRLELELARQLGGKDEAAAQKLFDRIHANSVVSASEAEFVGTLPKDPAGRQPVLERLPLLPVDAAEKQWLAALIQRTPAAGVPTIDRALQLTRALVAKSGAGSMSLASAQVLNEALTRVLAGTSTLDGLVASVWQSLRDLPTEFASRLDALQMGLPSGAGPANAYPPATQPERSAVRQVAERVLTPFSFPGMRYILVSRPDGSTVEYAPVGPAAPDVSLAEHQGKAVVLNGAAIVRFDPLTPYNVTYFPPLPVTTQTYRLADQAGMLLAVSGQPNAGEPALLRFDDGLQTWQPVAATGQVPAGPLNVVASVGEHGLLAVGQAGAAALLQNDAWAGLPTLPSGFVAESATSDGGRVLVTGVATSTSGTTSRVLYSVDPSSPSADWQLVGQDLPWLVLDRDHALSAPTPAHLPTRLRIDAGALAPKGVSYTPEQLERMTRLTAQTIDALASGGPLGGDGVTTVVELLETLKEAGALKPELAKQADALFAAAALDDDALQALGERFYQPRLSTLTEAEVAAAGAALVAQRPISHQALAQFAAQSRASSTQLELLLAIPQAALAQAEVDLLAAEAARAFSTRVNASLERPLTEATATELLRAAAQLKTSLPSVAALADANVRRLLVLGRMSGTTPDLFRSALADLPPVSEPELRLAVAWFAKHGGVTTTELRALTALTDSDGVRSEGEQRVLESLDWRTLAPDARGHLPRVVQSVTVPSDLAGVTPAVPGSAKIDGTGPLVVWAKETNASSGGATVSVGVEAPVETTPGGLVSGPIRITGKAALTTVEGLVPFPNGGTVTDDGFDQVQSLWGADNVLQRLKAVGVDLSSFLQHAQNNGTMKIKANAISAKNAFYSPSANEVTMGTSDDTWHLASDTDVVTHELGHFTLDHLNPNILGGGEGGAIHEGFGDLMTALLFNDPEVAEDFNPGNNPTWLRNAENEFTLSSVSTESHDRGQVYAGFGWSMKKKVAELVGDDLEAANLMLGVTVAHALMYDTSSVTPELFLAAMLKGADGFLQGKVADSVLATLKQAMVDEGVKRGLVPPGWVPAAGTSSPQLMAALTAGVRGAPALGPGGMSGLDLAHRLTAFTQRSEVTYRVVAEPRVGAMRKAILQAHVTSPDGQTYPVEDGFVTVALNHETIEAVGGRGRTLPTFDFTEPSFTADQAREKARDLALKGLAEGDARTNGYVQANIDEIFAPQNVRYQEVLSGGQRARKVITQAAEFTVRRDGTIEVSKVMHVD